MERKKLELPINQTLNLQLLFDEPIQGESQYGKYFMYGVKNGSEEFNFFAPLKVHEALKNKTRGTRFQLTKTAQQKGKKLVQDFEIKFLNNGKEMQNNESKSEENGYYEAMLKCYEEATRIQKQFSPASVSQTAITLFIAKTKTNGFNNFYKE